MKNDFNYMILSRRGITDKFGQTITQYKGSDLLGLEEDVQYCINDFNRGQMCERTSKNSQVGEKEIIEMESFLFQLNEIKIITASNKPPADKATYRTACSPIEKAGYDHFAYYNINFGTHRNAVTGDTGWLYFGSYKSEQQANSQALAEISRFNYLYNNVEQRHYSSIIKSVIEQRFREMYQNQKHKSLESYISIKKYSK